MRLSRDTWSKYQRAHSTVQRRAYDEAAEYFDSLPWDTQPALAERMMQARVVELAERYGLADGEISAIYYDELMLMQGAAVPPAEIAPTLSAQIVAHDVSDALTHATSPETAKTAMGEVTARAVKRCGLETTRQNAVRDGAMWAWVCIGDTCAFCRTLGSQGWVYASKAVRAGNHAEHIHANCDCQFVVKPIGADMEIEGYDPDALLAEYASHSGNSRDRINAMRRDMYTQDYADERNARRREQYAAAKAARESDETAP